MAAFSENTIAVIEFLRLHAAIWKKVLHILYCDERAKSFWVNADLRAQMFARALKIVSADLLNFSARYGIMILWLNSMKGCLRSGRGE